MRRTGCTPSFQTFFGPCSNVRQEQEMPTSQTRHFSVAIIAVISGSNPNRSPGS
jgi:hypothetical protein